MNLELSPEIVGLGRAGHPSGLSSMLQLLGDGGSVDVSTNLLKRQTTQHGHGINTELGRDRAAKATLDAVIASMSK